MIRPTWRIYLATGAFGGLILGLNAAIIELVHDDPNQTVFLTTTRRQMLYLVFGPLIGIALGLFGSPFVVGLIVKKDLRVAAPLLIGGAATADLAVSTLWPEIRLNYGPVFHVVLASLAVGLIGGVLWKWLPNTYGPFENQRCQGCGYRLTGTKSRTCPECGRHVPLAVMSLDEPIDHTK